MGVRRKMLGLVLVLVILESVVSPAMAINPEKIEPTKKLPTPVLARVIWESWPHKDSEVEIKWGGSTHMTIAEEAGRAMGIGEPHLTVFKEYSVKPDEEDSMWWPPWCPDRLCKHVYDPNLHFGTAPQACNEKVWSAINYCRQGKLREAYQELGRAAHYLMDVGNPYHSNLGGDLNIIKIKHDFYERYVESYISQRELDNVAYTAPKISISSPYSAVKELASFSAVYRSALDSAIGVRCNYHDPTGACLEWEAYPVNENLIKYVTKNLIRKTAGYTKGLVEYFEINQLRWRC